MSRVLLVDTNRAAVPIYRALVEWGHDVWVVGGNPAEPLARMSGNYVEMDYSDRFLMRQLIDRENFDYLVPGCTDLVLPGLCKNQWRTVSRFRQSRTI